jgi:hypothetical protein
VNYTEIRTCDEFNSESSPHLQERMSVPDDEFIATFLTCKTILIVKPKQKGFGENLAVNLGTKKNMFLLPAFLLFA